MTVSPAARVGDEIAHSNAGTGMLLGVLAGAAVGAVLVAATVATGGLALVAAAGAAAGMVSAGGLGGMYIGEASMGPPCGRFTDGSPNVFINGRPALFTAGSFASCDKDSGRIPLATGSSSVFINTGMAGREGEKVGCSAVSVAKVSPNVFIGGDSAQDPRVEIQPEVPAWAVTGLQILGVAGAIAALPFAIATVGVAATIGGAVLGGIGAYGGAKGGRALGEALGLSEAGKRALETAGGFLGGMVGGAAGTKGTQWFNKNYQIKVDPNALGMNGGNIRIVPRVNSRAPINSQYAGSRYPASKLPPKLAAKYPDGVKFTKDGFPEFPSKADVTLPPNQHINARDAHFREANRMLQVREQADPGYLSRQGLTDRQISHIMKQPPSSLSPPELTWHHNEQPGLMQLVPRDLHNEVRHTGGHAIWGR